MRYRAFSSFHVGYSHVKNDLVCEDCALSHNDDPLGRYYIAVVSDGHSDKKCFRSSKGAQFACEAAKEVLSRFFDLYLEDRMNYEDLPENAKERLKKSIKQCWDNKVSEDIHRNPLKEEELEPLPERVRNVYESGRGLQNIYGATFLASAICNDLFIVMHIGDGVLMCISQDGTYYEPVRNDEKSDMGEPASICNTDLFTREDAFRCEFFKEKPLAIVVSSDGIGDCMDSLRFREFVYTMFSKFKSMETENAENVELNESQQKYLESCVSYWADKNHGVEDDCSLAGIYLIDKKMPKVRIPLEYAEKLWDETVTEHNDVIQDYERRKKDIISNIDELGIQALTLLTNQPAEISAWLEVKGKIEELKKILRTIENNEKEKKNYYDEQLKVCEEYISRAGGSVEKAKLCNVGVIDQDFLAEDLNYFNLKQAQDDLLEKQKQEEKVLEERKQAVQKYEEAKRKVTNAIDHDLRQKAEQEVVALMAKEQEVSKEYEAVKNLVESATVKVKTVLKNIISNEVKKKKKKNS